MPEATKKRGLLVALILFVLVLLALILRCRGISDRWLDWDEAFMLALARLTVPVLIKTISVIDIHPPGAHLLLHGWVSLFGESDAAVRLFSVFFGLLGIAGTYLLALKISRSQKIAVLTALLTVVSPFVTGFSRMVTIHGVFYTLSVWSWVLLLALLEKYSWQRLVLYALITLWMLYTETTAPVVVVSQMVFWGFQWRLLSGSLRKAMPALAVFFAVAYLPWVWLIAQPWHASHMAEMSLVHPAADISTLLWAPADLFWRGSDFWFLPQPPALDDWLIFGLPGTALLLAAAYFVWKKEASGRMPIVCLGLLPIAMLFAVAMMTGRHVFQYRAMIFAVMGLNLMVSVWIVSGSGLNKSLNKSWKQALVVLLILGFQTFGWQLEAANHTRFLETVRDVRAGFRSGDGLIVYPGWMHIGVMRYFDPPRYGFTPNELNLDPRRGNLFHMVNLIDDRDFFVSGEDILKRSDVQQALQAFMAKHPRIWVLGMSDMIRPYFRCDRDYMILGNDGRYRQVRCPQRS